MIDPGEFPGIVGLGNRIRILRAVSKVTADHLPASLLKRENPIRGTCST